MGSQANEDRSVSKTEENLQTSRAAHKGSPFLLRIRRTKEKNALRQDQERV